MKKCSKCEVVKPLSEFHKSRRHRDGLKSECGSCRNLAYSNYCKTEGGKRFGLLRNRRRRKRDRAAVLGYYSNGAMNCARCGFTDERALSIDHIQGGGNAHRREIGGTTLLYRWLVVSKFPVGFQVLCMNCQFIKRHENKECLQEKDLQVAST